MKKHPIRFVHRYGKSVIIMALILFTYVCWNIIERVSTEVLASAIDDDEDD